MEEVEDDVDDVVDVVMCGGRLRTVGVDNEDDDEAVVCG